MEAANHFPMNMTLISKDDAKAGDELTISTSRRSPLSQKSTLHENILRNGTSSDNMESETCKSSCSKTIDILGNEITYLNQEIKRLKESVQPKALFNLEKFPSNDKKIIYYTGFQTYF
ncbi:hypothetical protein JTB14_028484 [Gonioctena quinquepunctata]|nr:hypothetical protein JTB14_028484 [Gonioctena quinquepunctata]